MDEWFWNVGVNDEMWVATTVDVGSGLRMYDDLISSMIDGGDEVCGIMLCRVELYLTIFWVVLICWALRNRFGKLLINC